jgi:hypothetical protein
MKEIRGIMTFTIISKKHGDLVVEIDDEDKNRVLRHTWQISDGSIQNRPDMIAESPLLCIQCLILQDIKMSDDETICYRDGNLLNNKKENLYVCLQVECEHNEKVSFAKDTWCTARRKFCKRVRFHRDKTF